MKRFRKILYYTSAALGSLLVLLIGFDIFWDTAAPKTTCTSCHEIESSSAAWANSGHRSFSCRECHGTAFSDGLHSLMEKGKMVVRHFTGTGAQDVRLNESQVVEMLGNCKRCHGLEYAKWISGGHSATYAAIFLNEKHNSREELNPDCLRCHGMYFGKAVKDLVSPISVRGPWELMKPEQASRPVIPCLSCHEIHRRGSPAVSPDYSDPKRIFYDKLPDSLQVVFYDRYEKVYIEASDLPLMKISMGSYVVKVSDDPRQRVCIQCHAPNAFHTAGTSDDRTPRGVHEGLSCLACHDSHSNDPRQSCVNCHPAISNCGLDVSKMNTTFADKGSPHNIHFVSCLDCHTKGIPQKRT